MEKGFSENFEGKPPVISDMPAQPEYRKKKTEVTSLLTSEEISDLADKVSSILKKMKTLPEYNGKQFLLCRSIAIRAVLGLPRYGKLDDASRADYEAIKSELSRRGGERTGAKNKNKKMHKVPKGRIFTPAQINNMIEQAQKLQDSDEERAGQTWEDSDL